MTIFSRTLVFSLLGNCRPIAVLWRIAKIVIATFDAIGRNFPVPSFWAQSHVGKEILERSFPSITNRNPSAAVRIPALILATITTVTHGTPNAVFVGMPHAVGSGGIPGFGPFSLKASATFGIATTQRTTLHVNNSSARTSAFPNRLALVTPGGQG
jgi:hypothetical protein